MNQEVTVLDEFKDILPLQTRDGFEDTHFVDFKQIHSALGVGTSPRKWLGVQIRRYDFIEGEDYLAIKLDQEAPDFAANVQKNGGSLVETYLISADIAKELCMVQRTPLGKRVRKYFILAEKVARKYARTELLGAVKAANLAAYKTKTLLNDRNKETEQLAKALQKAQGVTKPKSVDATVHEVWQENHRNQVVLDIGLERNRLKLVLRGWEVMEEHNYNPHFCKTTKNTMQTELDRSYREHDCISDPY